MYVNWYCWDSCFWRPSINWNYPDNQVLEAILWKPAATTLQRAINWFGQYTTIPRYDCLPNRMEKFPVNPTICKVRLYYALLWVVSIQWGVSISIQLIGTRSWHLSSNWLRGRRLKLIVRTILSSNRRNQLFRYFHLIDSTRNQLFVQFHLIGSRPKQVFRHFQLIESTGNQSSGQFQIMDQHPKSIAWTIPITWKSPKSVV